MNIIDRQYDNVINSEYLLVKTDYEFVNKNLVPLIHKLEFQRNTLKSSFYDRLKHDIISGCIIPPLTIAFRLPQTDVETITVGFLMNNLDKAFVLDGIQRLNTINSIFDDDGFPKDKAIYLNILICDSMNKLLYRMVTLNNGQKPMSARHQIEILANSIIDFDNLPLLIQTEKSKNIPHNKADAIMSKEVVIKGYIAFISNSTNIDNQKIIESKMDELIAEKIMDASLPEQSTEYYDVIKFVNQQLENQSLNKWFSIPNNFIGFAAAMSQSFSYVSTISTEELQIKIGDFEDAFSFINVSKVNLGVARRKAVHHYFENLKRYESSSVSQVLDAISEVL